jgi:hypothetical protein
VIVLHGSGAGVTEIFGPALPEKDWEALRRNTGRLLAARGNAQAASALQKLPFELRGGTNYFQDEFSVLYAVLPLEQYIRVEEIKASSASLFRSLAETISEIGPYTRFVVVELEAADEPAPVPPPSPQVTSEAVEAALADAEHLIRAKSAASALDRVHTALHGYLRVVLDREGIAYEPKAPVTRLFKLLREKHPQFRQLGARSEDLWRIVTSMASVVDALNVLRNNASIAHPNEALLEAAEAMLAINSARTLFHYLDSKIES